MWKDVSIYVANNNPQAGPYYYDAEKQDIGHVEYWPKVLPIGGDLVLIYYKPLRSITRITMCLGKIELAEEGKLTDEDKKLASKYGLMESDIGGERGSILKDIYRFQYPIKGGRYAMGNPFYNKFKDEWLREVLSNQTDPGKKELRIHIRMYRLIKYWMKIHKNFRNEKTHTEYHMGVHKEVLDRFKLLNNPSMDISHTIERILTSPTNTYNSTFKKAHGWPHAIPDFIKNASEDEKREVLDILKEMDQYPKWKDEWVDKIFKYFEKYSPPMEKAKEMGKHKSRYTNLYTLLAELYGYRHIEEHPLYNSPVRGIIEKLFELQEGYLKNNYSEFERYFNEFKEFYKAIMCFIKNDETKEKECEFVEVDESNVRYLNFEIDALLWLTASGYGEMGESLKKAFESIMKDKEIDETIPEPPNPPAEDYLLKILDKEGQVILYGPVGTGKTYQSIQHIKKYADAWDMITFHQSYGYEEFVEGLKPKIDNNGQLRYIVEDGLFKRLALKALLMAMEKYQGSLGKYDALLKYLNDESSTNYDEYVKLKKELWDKINNMSKEELQDMFRDAPRVYLLIDEINRGNISKIFGELITHLEKDKRIGEENWIPTTLPYSQEKFGIPPNLYIIGTMNTSDRSITLLDIALRRRFGFYEVLPKYDIPEMNRFIEGINLSDFLKALNRVLIILKDRDHQIGHAYLLNVESLEDLRYVWYNKIIPLLEEYFYNDIESFKKILKTFIEDYPEDIKNISVSLGLPGEEEKVYDIKDLEGEDFVSAIEDLIKIWKGEERSGET